MIDYPNFYSKDIDNASSSESQFSGRSSSLLSQQLRKQTKKLGQINAKIDKQTELKEMFKNLYQKDQLSDSRSGSSYSSMKSSSDLDSIDKDMKQIRQYFGKKQHFSNLKDVSQPHNDTTLASFGKATRNKIWSRTPVIIINQKNHQEDVTRYDHFYQPQQIKLDQTRKRRQNKQQQRIGQILWKQDVRKQYLKSKQQRQQEQRQEREQIRAEIIRQMQRQQQNQRSVENQRDAHNITKRGILQQNLCYNLAGKTKRNTKLELCMKALSQGKDKCSNLRHQINLMCHFRNFK